jgi:hypothetical protein
MKLYHGSPKKLKIIKPQKAKGINKFQNQKAIFLTKSFKQEALFALGKSLKGKTSFYLPPGRLIIKGKYKPKEKAYVYEVNVNAIKGDLGNYEYAYKKPINKFMIHLVKLRHYKKYIKTINNLK